MKIDDAKLEIPQRSSASVPTPSAGTVTQFLDSATGHLSQKDSSGTVIDLAASGSATPAGNDTEIQFNNAGAFGASPNFAFDGNGILVGPSHISTTNTVADLVRSNNANITLRVQNPSAGGAATSNLTAAADTGTDTANFVRLGIKNSANVQAFLGNALDGYCFGNGGDFQVGSATAAKDLVLFAGGTADSDRVALIKPAKAFHIVKAPSVPAAPSTDMLSFFMDKVAGHGFLFTDNDTGNVGCPLQPHFGFKQVVWARSNMSTNNTAMGCVITGTGTATAATLGATNRHNLTPRVEYIPTASATAVSGWRMGQNQFSIGGALAGNGGFFASCLWLPSLVVATGREFCGMGAATAAPTDVEPSSITNIVGFGLDAADTQIQLMYRNTGAVTKVALGANFARVTPGRSEVFFVAFYSPPGLTQSVACFIKNLDTGNSFSQTLTTGLPTTATFLSMRAWNSVGGTSGQCFTGFSNMYIESDGYVY